MRKVKLNRYLWLAWWRLCVSGICLKRRQFLHKILMMCWGWMQCKHEQWRQCGSYSGCLLLESKGWQSALLSYVKCALCAAWIPKYKSDASAKEEHCHGVLKLASLNTICNRATLSIVTVNGYIMHFIACHWNRFFNPKVNLQTHRCFVLDVLFWLLPVTTVQCLQGCCWW